MHLALVHWKWHACMYTPRIEKLSKALLWNAMTSRFMAKSHGWLLHKIWRLKSHGDATDAHDGHLTTISIEHNYNELNPCHNHMNWICNVTHGSHPFVTTIDAPHTVEMGCVMMTQFLLLDPWGYVTCTASIWPRSQERAAKFAERAIRRLLAAMKLHKLVCGAARNQRLVLNNPGQK
jgi:hypothetical protein